MAKTEMTYTEALKQLQEIVQKIENEEPEVDELNSMVKKASKLITYCKAKLKGTEEELKKTLDSLD